MSEVRLQVQSLDAFIGDTVEMAERLDKGETGQSAFRLSFERMEQLLKVLTVNRWALLRRLKEEGASSIRSLAKALERDYRGVHADVTALIEAGLIERDPSGSIAVPWSRITAEMEFDSAA